MKFYIASIHRANNTYLMYYIIHGDIYKIKEELDMIYPEGKLIITNEIKNLNDLDYLVYSDIIS
jgi:hypothetical protein